MISSVFKPSTLSRSSAIYLLTMAGGSKPRLRQDIQDNIQLQDSS
jgi:hypothetical protein